MQLHRALVLVNHNQRLCKRETSAACLIEKQKWVAHYASRSQLALDICLLDDAVELIQLWMFTMQPRVDLISKRLRLVKQRLAHIYVEISLSA